MGLEPKESSQFYTFPCPLELLSPFISTLGCDHSTGRILLHMPTASSSRGGLETRGPMLPGGIQSVCPLPEQGTPATPGPESADTCRLSRSTISRVTHSPHLLSSHLPPAPGTQKACSPGRVWPDVPAAAAQGSRCGSCPHGSCVAAGRGSGGGTELGTTAV